MAKDLTITLADVMQTDDSEYMRLVSLISGVWEKARGKVVLAIDTELLDSDWQICRYLVGFEQE